MIHLVLLSSVVGFAHMILPMINPDALEFSRECYMSKGFLVVPANCTCSKTDPQTAGVVQWTAINGSVVDNQQISADHTYSILFLYAPYGSIDVDKNTVSYICRIVNDSGVTVANRGYTANLAYGPGSASLTFLSGEAYMCPSGQTNELDYYCDVPADYISPQPIFTAEVDGHRWGDSDYLPGVFVEYENVWRLQITFRLNSTGAHKVYCGVKNMVPTNSFLQLNLDITVQDAPPPGYSC